MTTAKKEGLPLAKKGESLPATMPQEYQKPIWKEKVFIGSKKSTVV